MQHFIKDRKSEHLEKWKYFLSFIIFASTTHEFANKVYFTCYSSEQENAINDIVFSVCTENHFYYMTRYH